jgi:hypothetical protein
MAGKEWNHTGNARLGVSSLHFTSSAIGLKRENTSPVQRAQ